MTKIVIYKNDNSSLRQISQWGFAAAGQAIGQVAQTVLVERAGHRRRDADRAQPGEDRRQAETMGDPIGQGAQGPDHHTHQGAGPERPAERFRVEFRHLAGGQAGQEQERDAEVGPPAPG